MQGSQTCTRESNMPCTVNHALHSQTCAAQSNMPSAVKHALLSPTLKRALGSQMCTGRSNMHCADTQILNITAVSLVCAAMPSWLMQKSTIIDYTNQLSPVHLLNSCPAMYCSKQRRYTIDSAMYRQKHECRHGPNRLWPLIRAQ